MPTPSLTALNWTLGPYRILREIGRGQFGTVYEAFDAQGRQIALKLVPVGGADSEQKVAAEQQGAALQQRFSRLSNGLVPEVMDHHRIDPYYAIAMELVSGQPLTAVIKAGPIPAARAATIASAICRFLIKAHEFTTDAEDQSQSILVHGDLKPAHILLLDDGSIRVLDFGIAKALATRKTATTNLWSSVDYASPERLESGRVNKHADFWSLGVILFEMLAGVRPYAQYERDRSRLESAIRKQEPRLRVPPDADRQVTAIVDKLLATQIENRYQTARQIADDLQAFLEGTTVIAYIEALRADQATVRMAPQPAILRVEDSIVATEPIPRSPLALPAPAPEGPGELVVLTAVRPPAETAPVVSPGAAPHPAAESRRYKPLIAALLSFLAPGFGQIYNREYVRGIFWLIVTPGFWITSAGLFGWPFHILAAYTAYRRAQMRNDLFGVTPMRLPRLPILGRRAAA
jgi:serine/threonine protein kinase